MFWCVLSRLILLKLYTFLAVKKTSAPASTLFTAKNVKLLGVYHWNDVLPDHLSWRLMHITNIYWFSTGQSLVGQETQFKFDSVTNR